jgi:hypothetical protein
VTLLGAVGEGKLGPAALVGPDGWRIDQIRVIRNDGVPRTVLRVRRCGRFVAEVRSIDELAALGVDLVVDEPDPAM